MKTFLVGLTIAAAAIGGGIAYATLSTGGGLGGGLGGGSESFGGALGWGDQSDSAVVAPAGQGQAFAPDDVVISAAELNQMVTDAIATHPNSAPVLNITEGVTTVIEGDRIKSGARINLSDIPLESLPTEGQQAVERITQTFPFLNDRKVYVGIEGRPSVVDGQISLANTNVRLGQLKLPIADIASQYGFSQTDIEQQLSALLEQQGLTPEDIRVVDGRLVISGLPQ
ncbi:MAG: hypothetical protein AAF716_04450 [Cyanobacteria bacterium P01_D01_bin.1]